MIFSTSEFKARMAKVKQSMLKQGIDVLLVSNPANQNYLTGYDGWSFYTPQMVLVSLEIDQPIWFGRQMDAVGAKFTSFLSEESVIPYPDKYVGSTDLHPMDYLATFIIDKGLAKGTIGVEMDDYYYTAKWHAILTNKLHSANFVDAFLLVNWARMVKSEHELLLMEQAGQIASKAMQGAYNVADVGVRQCDVMAEVYRITTSGTDEFGGTFPCKPPNAMVGELCSAPHLSWTDAPLQKDEIFYIELGGIRHRYHSPLARCIYLGQPSKEIHETAKIIAEGLNAVLDTVKPGILCRDLETAWRKVINKHGITKDSRIGYPVGIGYPPTWGELTCSLRGSDETVIEENMTFHCIPALWFQNYGLVISESFAVTASGAKTFSDYPRELLVKNV
ncbi:Xaa-Pro peptidase family protein [Vreelandella glaciei]|uniref:M24 family metallopeptidase n=1 Tax=Vreelandella glaciei TaxID=186761 RepID=UPI0030EE9B83|tara:strand:+ start:7174 stop:8346 length:1173 start_codon:yes stop_codon:yes gene_type:complete